MWASVPRPDRGPFSVLEIWGHNSCTLFAQGRSTLCFVARVKRLVGMLAVVVAAFDHNLEAHRVNRIDQQSTFALLSNAILLFKMSENILKVT